VDDGHLHWVVPGVWQSGQAPRLLPKTFKEAPNPDQLVVLTT
jgi:hypothetical protein